MNIPPRSHKLRPKHDPYTKASTKPVASRTTCTRVLQNVTPTNLPRDLALSAEQHENSLAVLIHIACTTSLLIPGLNRTKGLLFVHHTGFFNASPTPMKLTLEPYTVFLGPHIAKVRRLSDTWCALHGDDTRSARPDRQDTAAFWEELYKHSLSDIPTAITHVPKLNVTVQQNNMTNYFISKYLHNSSRRIKSATNKTLNYYISIQYHVYKTFVIHISGFYNSYSLRREITPLVY